MIPEWASSGPPLIIFLFFAVSFRSQVIYWLGRAAARGALKANNLSGFPGKVAALFSGPIPQRGAQLLEKWGPLIIPACFLTVGIQTAVNSGAGMVRMKWHLYTLYMIPGCMIWAIMYGLGMLAVWRAALRAAAGNPWVLSIILLAVGTLALWLIRKKRRKVLASVETSGAVGAQAE